MIDVTTQGVVPGVDCSAIVQSIVDSITSPTILKFPGNTVRYIFSKPIFCDRNDLIIEGDGNSSWLYGLSAAPIFQFGLQRPYLSANHWVDLFGILDTTLAVRLGQRIGYRTSLDSHIHFSGSPLTSGPMASNLPTFWKTTTQLTIDLGVVNNGVWNTDLEQLCGASDIHGPAPWYLFVGNGAKIVFKFMTSDGVIRTASWYFDKQLTQRISVQLDLTNAIVSCWGNGVQLIPSPNTNLGLDFIPGNSLRFRYDGTSTFGFGSIGAGLIGWGSPVGAPADLTFMGFRLTTALCYTGTTQVRIDDKPLNDANRFYLLDPATFFRLQLDDVVGSPLVHGYGIYHIYGFFISSNLNNGNTITGNQVRDLFLQNSTPFGQTISIGSCYDMLIQNSKIMGGLHNIGSLVSGVAYPIRLRDLILTSPGDCNYFGYEQIIWANGLTLQYPGPSAITLQGCNAHFENIFITDSNRTEKVIKLLNAGGNGGLFDFNNIIADFEGGSPSCYMYLEQHANTPMTALNMNSCAFGKIAQNCQHVRLVSTLNAKSSQLANISQLGSVGTCSIHSDPGWNVILDTSVVVQ